MNSKRRPVFYCSGEDRFSVDVAGHPRHVRARKLEREVEVQFADADCIVRTPEGMVYAHPGDAILTGNGGQHWRVSRAKFANKYRPLAPTVAGESGRYVSLPNVILALQMDELFEVALQDGVSRLLGRPGDWLVDYGDGSLGVVAEGIFAITYEVLS